MKMLYFYLKEYEKNSLSDSFSNLVFVDKTLLNINFKILKI